MRHLVLYGREGCHLCEDMAAALDEFKASLQFDYVVVDVDSGASLAERYGLLVPVLVRDGREICHYFLDKVALEAGLLPEKVARSE